MLTLEQKLKICDLRLSGCSVVEIVNEMKITRQSVNNNLKKFPGENNQKVPLPQNLSHDEMLAVCKVFIEQSRTGIKKGEAEIFDLLSAETGIPSDQIRQIFSFIKKRWANFDASSIAYPKLAEWMRRNNFSINQMSRQIGISAPVLQEMLSNRYDRHLTLDAAVKINDFTGISVQDIFSER